MTLSSTNADAPGSRRANGSRASGLVRSAVFAAGLAALFVPQSVWADVPPSARTLARSLFEQARALIAEKKFTEACPKLAESMRLDPAAGTQLNLAVCHEGEGKTATAWAEYNDALTQARRDGRPEREEFIAAKLRALSPRLTTLAVTLAPGADVPGLEVSIDGAAAGPAAFGTPTPVDPGSHTIAAKAPGFTPWMAPVTVGAEDGKRVVVVPRLTEVRSSVSDAARPARTLGPEPTASTHESLGSPAGASATRESPRKTWGYTLLGTGLLSAGVGAAFGVDAIVKWHDRNADCTRGCNPAGVQAGSAATTSAWVSDVTIGAGVAAAAVGTYLLLVPGAHSIQTGSRAQVRVIPIVTGSEIGLGFAGVIQ